MTTRPLRGPFRFHADPHCYTVGGVLVPGVNAALRAGGEVADLSFLSDEYRRRGKAVHAATLHYDLTGEAPTLPEDWQPYLQAYVRLRETVRCRWRALEQPRVSRVHRYASTPDRVGTVTGVQAVVEIKTGYPAGFHGPQLAGQDLLLPRGGVRSPRRRLGFYLRRDGSYRVEEFTDPADYMTFLRALARWWEASDGEEGGGPGGDDDWL